MPPSFRKQTLSKPVRTRMALEELGILKDGREVVIKVRKPGAYEQVKEDIDILRELAITRP